MANNLERHDYACCEIFGLYHITISATETLCGVKWRYRPNLEKFKRPHGIARLHFLSEKEISCKGCVIIAKQKEALGEKF